MKLKPIMLLKSLGWNKGDAKKIVMFIIMLSIGCFVLNNFVVISIDGNIYTDTSVDGSVDTRIRGSIDTDTSISGTTYINTMSALEVEIDSSRINPVWMAVD